MASLNKPDRKRLESAVQSAREVAEKGARQAIESLLAHAAQPAELSAGERGLRNQLRAHGRQLGDSLKPDGTQAIDHLVRACAYEHWHRLLFARFLAENDLLLEPKSGVAIALDEVQEMARTAQQDWLDLAASYAQRMLPAIFRPEDPVLQVSLPPEARQKLEAILEQLPATVFTADDSLGWVYQFWQAKEKDRVNKSEVKIGADEIAPVTQLFTEDYMVLFLLHNTLGAWWMAKRQGEGKGAKLSGYDWTYLRLNDRGQPAVGGYDGWPRTARELKILDPCMGSGHFLAFALPIVARMRVEEEGLSLEQAVAAALRDNLFGLEIDERCSQIAAFNLAQTAWRIVGHYFELPRLNLACSGLSISATEDHWVNLAGSDDQARDTMRRLYALFSQAPILGSLVDPLHAGGRGLAELGFVADLAYVLPILHQALAAEADMEAHELAVAASGLAEAAAILGSRFTLVATNVPYLRRGKQGKELKAYCEDAHASAKADLATCFVERSLRLCDDGGSVVLVTPQNWLFLTSYRKLRERLLMEEQWDFVARLGPHAFETITGEVVNVALLGLTRQKAAEGHAFAAWDVSEMPSTFSKAELLKTTSLTVSQAGQLRNPDNRIAWGFNNMGQSLGDKSICLAGIMNGDSPMFQRQFWEIAHRSPDWVFQQTTTRATRDYYGFENLILFDEENGHLRADPEFRDVHLHNSDERGSRAWGKRGVAISQMRDLPTSNYLGDKFDSNVAVIVPHDPNHLPAILAFCSSPEFARAVREIDQKVNVTNATLGKVSFDLTYWQDIASVTYPTGLSKPLSDDPTQWIFSGHPTGSDQPLHVAVARLLGYRWPRQTGSSFMDCPALGPDGLEGQVVTDGIAPMMSLSGKPPVAELLRALLAQAYGDDWSATRLSELLSCKDPLEEWLRDCFFEEHCKLFHDRPFIWHVWDGRKDGFHALVNYHRLAAPNGDGHRTLERLIYTYLGDWITRQEAEVAAETEGADGRLVAARHLKCELEKILEGKDSYDIFVRWKPLHEQAIGWEPDINDGVRLNIRPWLEAKPYQAGRNAAKASILRVRPKIRYGIDRGNEPARDAQEFPWFANTRKRNNDIHLSIDQKRSARDLREINTGTAPVPGALKASAAGTAALPAAKGWNSRGYLPHFDGGPIPQSVTFRLAGVIPQDLIRQWDKELGMLADKEAAEQRFKRIEEYLDRCDGAAWLKDPRIAELVHGALLHFDGERYRLHAWVVMPTHVHVLFTPLPEHQLGAIVSSWKSYTAKRANEMLGREGEFWYPDYFDRYIRNQEHFEAAVKYIENNPVKAGLCSLPRQWPYGSAGGTARVPRALKARAAGTAAVPAKPSGETE